MAEKFKIPEVLPYHVQWDVTSGCNHRCTFCLTASGQPDPNELSTTEALELIDRLHDEGIWFLKIMGGEPFFRKDILTLFRHAARKNMVISFSTNASLVTEEIAATLSEIRNSIIYTQMSLYGESRETYRRVTGSAGHFDFALKGLSRLVEAGLDVSVLTVITPENVANLPGYYEIVRQAGAKEFRLVSEVALGRSADRADANGPQARGIWPVFLESLERIKTGMTADDPIIMLDARPLFGTYLTQLTGCRIFYENCTAATTMIYVGPTGEAFPCPFIKHMPDDMKRLYSHLVPGNIRAQSFWDIWTSKTFETFRSYYDPEHNLFKINTACRYFKSGKCIPCAVTPCNCLDMIKLVKSELGGSTSSSAGTAEATAVEGELNLEP